jgi:adenylate cyclase
MFDPSYEQSDDNLLAGVLANMKAFTVVATGLKRGIRRQSISVIRDAVAASGLANLPVSTKDRTLRSFRTAFADRDGELHDVLATILARHAGIIVTSNTDDIAIDWYGRPGWSGVDGLILPPIATFSARNFIKAPAAAALLEGKYIFIGATFEGSGDFFRTPFHHLNMPDATFSGVQAHAQILAQLLDGRTCAQWGIPLQWALTLLTGLLGLMLALWRMPALVPFGLVLVLPVLWIVGVFLLCQEWGLVVPAISPALALGLSLGGFALYRARRFDHSQRIAAKALYSYLPPKLARQVLSDPNFLKLSGEQREVTILFTDIAGFTGYSETHNPDEVVALLNGYLNRVAEIILHHNGIIDKFVLPPYN